MSPYAEIDVHGTPAGYKAGCKTDAMCDDSAPWSCKRAYERYRGDYQFHMRIDEGLTPHEIHELEQADAQRIAEEERTWLEREGMKPAKPAKAEKKPKPRYVNQLASIDPLGGYAAATVAAARERIACAPTPDPTSERAALAKDRVSIEMTGPGLVIPTPKENPMPDPTALPAGLAWKQPPARALQKLARGSKTKNELAIAAAKSKPGQWLSLGEQNASGITRWRKGEVAGTKPGEFDAIIDVAEPTAKRGELFIRYIGVAK